MSKVKGGAAVAVVTAATVAVRKALDAAGVTGGDKPEDATRWRAVTVNLPAEDVLPGGTPPQPLAAWGDAIAVEIRPAPGDKGTELRARLLDPQTDAAPDGLDGETPVQKLRSALRRSKQLLETGEILRASDLGTSQSTALNAPLRAAIQESGGEGRL